ncbi:DUF3373 domain-containing protein [Desulfuromonas carbonis]|uniref:DUF3373 domain-containing protein n=1 Tax=Desulfuromonas sp. DDH964 TaxID=1823759 RepID=UPI00078CFE69|nr:DUF3373 domain-containing protein [Desulfuromonas sp. DDH964]AMV71221.1 hypothetical protein DBW_0838 [Desulfuromonas sp. DDH964]
MRKLFALMLAILLMAPATVLAADSLEDLQLKVKDLTQELEELSKRIDKNEKHTALDRIQFSGDFRTKADTLHYQDVTFYPGVLVDFDQFVADAMSGTFGDPADPNSPIAKMMAANPSLATAFGMGLLSGVQPYAMAPAPKTSDINNDILYTTRLRLNMKAKVYDNVNFSGRLTMYKNWGDSTGSKVFDSWNSYTMDGTDSGSTSGDWLRVERAYFDWSNIGGSNAYLSIGRRPSTYGPPTQYRENEMRGGTPTGHLVNFNFDGITVGYHLSDLTGIEGQTIRFCYGQGFESEWGNGELFNDNSVNTKDTHLGGINLDVLNDGTNFLQFTMFRAMDVNDGFKGVIAFPNQFAALFAPTLYSDLQKFPNFNFVTRVQPSTVIGDINLAAIGFSREEMNGINWFASLAATQTDSNGKAGMFGGMNSDAIFQAELNTTNTEIIMTPARGTASDKEEGYGIYVGLQVPAPLGKIGLEYNYGSKFWTPFTQAQDDMIGSKLATRGHVGEAYYIFDVNPNMFIKLGGLYYDYQYTGSGSPVGAPHKIGDVQNGTAFSMLPAVDTAWDGYASLTVRF